MNSELRDKDLRYEDVLDRILHNGIELEDSSGSKAGGVDLKTEYEHIEIVVVAELESVVEVGLIESTPDEGRSG